MGDPGYMILSPTTNVPFTIDPFPYNSLKSER